MAHEIEGEKMVYNATIAAGSVGHGNRPIPWHEIGVMLQPEDATIEKAIDAADMDSLVEARPIYHGGMTTIDEDGNVVEFQGQEIDGYKAITRTMIKRDGIYVPYDNAVYAITTDHYVPVNNIDVAMTMQEFAQDTNLMVETAGSLRQGARCWLLVRIGEDFKIAGSDQIIPYMLADWGHDGKTPITFRTCLTRVVCANTLSAAEREGRVKYTVRHTRNAFERMKEATTVLGLVSVQMMRQREMFEKMAQMKADEELTTKVIEALTPEAKADASDLITRRAKEARLELWKTLNESPTVALVGRDTRYGVYNACTEFMEHIEERRGMMPHSTNGNWQEARVFDNLEGNNLPRRQMAFDMLTAGI